VPLTFRSIGNHQRKQQKAGDLSGKAGHDRGASRITG
jgi:hypothetical protein